MFVTALYKVRYMLSGHSAAQENSSYEGLLVVVVFFLGGELQILNLKEVSAYSRGTKALCSALHNFPWRHIVTYFVCTIIFTLATLAGRHVFTLGNSILILSLDTILFMMRTWRKHMTY